MTNAELVMESESPQKACNGEHKGKTGHGAALDRRIPIAEVAAHCTSDDFWTVVDDVVYDLSGYAPTHPGGSMILLGAGTDSTVMFHQYHLSEHDIAKHILSSRRIGTFDGKSPKMGLVYPELKRRVIQSLKLKPKRPQLGKVLLVVDQLCMCALIVFSLMTTAATPFWQLFLFTFIAPFVCLRIFGHSHALGHIHICHPRWVPLIGKSLLALGAPGIAMFMIPAADRNPRRLMNETRVVAQDEFPQRRGPGEHQSIHHVKGAEIEHDECYQVASMFGCLRLSEFQKHRWPHRFQHHMVFQFLAGALTDLSLVTAFGLTERVLALKSCYINQGLWADALAAVIGIACNLTVARTQLLLAWFHGCQGLVLLLGACLLKHLMFGSYVPFFFGQHKWDYMVSAITADEDWVTHNAEGSVSLRGVHRNPLCWGMAGACPSSLTYHLEHTLFPGVSYLHLPTIAPIVQDTLAEFGVTCKAVVGPEALQEYFQGTMVRYSISDAELPEYFSEWVQSMSQKCVQSISQILDLYGTKKN